jgi:hypothetical protein
MIESVTITQTQTHAKDIEGRSLACRCHDNIDTCDGIKVGHLDVRVMITQTENNAYVRMLGKYKHTRNDT